MELPDMNGDQDMQFLQAFKAMGPLDDGSHTFSSQEDERDAKKQKKHLPAQWTQTNQATTDVAPDGHQ